MRLNRLSGWLPVVALAVIAFFTASPPILAQQTGTVEGIVRDAETLEPIVGAQVTVHDTDLGTITNPQGEFTIPGVPAGAQRVRALFLGYAPLTLDAVVPAGGTVELEFDLREEAIGLEAIVVTAAGEEVRRRELGNVVGNITPTEADLSSVATFSDLIQGRSAGVTVSGAGGSVGTGARIRIRGASSVSLSNDPLIIIDGVRADNSTESGSIGVGGQSFSRFEDINPQDIETIEILKGPAATAMYGTAAAAGAIQITTKRGFDGDARWTAYTEQGLAQDYHDYPANWNARGTDGNAGCRIDLQASGACELDELISFNPIEEAGLIRDGHRQRYGLNVTGGSEQFTYYVSGEIQEDEGALPNNDLSRVNLRGNFNVGVTDNLDLNLRSGYTTSNTRLPQNDNNTLGLISGALLGTASDGPSGGWISPANGPDQLLQYETAQQVDRIVAGAEANWQAADWLAFRANIGMDNLSRHDNSFVPPRTIVFGDLFSGERVSNRIGVESYTARFSGRTSYVLSPRVAANTSVGGEFNRELFQGTYASATGLLDGTSSLNAGTDNFAVSEAFTDIRTLAGWVEQRIAFDDRIYLNAALRADDDNSFGDEFDLIWYPSLSLSWVMNEEDWFPEVDVLSGLRVRGAVGRAGLRPGFRDATFYLSPQTVNVDGGNEPGFSIGGSGNPDLRPEIVTEFEFGFDADLLSDRVGLEATYFHKSSEDALVSRRLAPSLGATTTRFENLAEVVNQGFEFGIDAQVLDRPGLQLDLGFSGSFTDNELTDLGDVEPIIFGLGGDSQRHQEGFPLGGYWGRTITELNVPDEGPVTLDDITLSDEVGFIGSALPTRELSFNLDARLFERVGLRALVDHQGGHYLFNSTREFRCAAFLNCQEVYDPDADPMAQAQALSGIFLGAPSSFVEPADFTRLREVALTFTAPENIAARVGVDALRLTLAGRNLATWTDYSGLDPELNFAGQANFSTADFLTQPPLRYYTARISVDF